MSKKKSLHIEELSWISESGQDFYPYYFKRDPEARKEFEPLSEVLFKCLYNNSADISLNTVINMLDIYFFVKEKYPQRFKQYLYDLDVIHLKNADAVMHNLEDNKDDRDISSVRKKIKKYRKYDPEIFGVNETKRLLGNLLKNISKPPVGIEDVLKKIIEFQLLIKSEFKDHYQLYKKRINLIKEYERLIRLSNEELHERAHYIITNIIHIKQQLQVCNDDEEQRKKLGEIIRDYHEELKEIKNINIPKDGYSKEDVYRILEEKGFGGRRTIEKTLDERRIKKNWSKPPIDTKRTIEKADELEQRFTELAEDKSLSDNQIRKRLIQKYGFQEELVDHIMEYRKYFLETS